MRSGVASSPRTRNSVGTTRDRLRLRRASRPKDRTTWQATSLGTKPTAAMPARPSQSRDARQSPINRSPVNQVVQIIQSAATTSVRTYKCKSFLTDPTPRHARPNSKARAKESKTTRVVHAFPRTGLIRLREQTTASVATVEVRLAGGRCLHRPTMKLHRQIDAARDDGRGRPGPCTHR